MADARFQELAVNYEDTVIRAAQEVEDAMVGFLQSQDAVFFLADAVKASKRSVDLSMIQYREGLVDYQRVLDTQRDLADQQDDLVFTAGSVGLNLVAMYRALGGGWEIRGRQRLYSGKPQRRDGGPDQLGQYPVAGKNGISAVPGRQIHLS